MSFSSLSGGIYNTLYIHVHIEASYVYVYVEWQSLWGCPLLTEPISFDVVLYTCCGELYFSIFLSLAAVVVCCVHL